MKRQLRANTYEIKEDYVIGKTSSGTEFMFDLEDFELVQQYTWGIEHYGYVVTSVPKPHRLHRLIMSKYQEIEGFEIDHINHDKLDNRKCNLRVCTHQQNNHNQQLKSSNTTGYKGPWWDKRLRKWRATIKYDSRTVYLGYYETAELAALAYNEAATDLFGEFASLNEIERSDFCEDSENTRGQ